jgi:hypothetical protein
MQIKLICFGSGDRFFLSIELIVGFYLEDIKWRFVFSRESTLMLDVMLLSCRLLTAFSLVLGENFLLI